MSLQSDMYQVVLLSNKTSNSKHKPNIYEMELAKSLDQLGKWAVSLIDISYSHN